MKEVLNNLLKSIQIAGGEGIPISKGVDIDVSGKPEFNVIAMPVNTIKQIKGNIGILLFFASAVLGIPPIKITPLHLYSHLYKTLIEGGK